MRWRGDYNRLFSKRSKNSQILSGFPVTVLDFTILDDDNVFLFQFDSMLVTNPEILM